MTPFFLKDVFENTQYFIVKRHKTTLSSRFGDSCTPIQFYRALCKKIQQEYADVGPAHENPIVYFAVAKDLDHIRFRFSCDSSDIVVPLKDYTAHRANYKLTYTYTNRRRK